MLFKAGRTLNAPVGCMVSSLSQTRVEVRQPKSSDATSGVGRK
jgi:hypothetical protein